MRRIVVRDRLRDLYLAPDGQWTADKTAARQFEELLFAYHFCQRENLTDVEIICQQPGRADLTIWLQSPNTPSK